MYLISFSFLICSSHALLMREAHFHCPTEYFYMPLWHFRVVKTVVMNVHTETRVL